MKPIAATESALNRARRVSAQSGVLALLSLAVVPEGRIADLVALFALLALGVATALSWPQLFRAGRSQPISVAVALNSPPQWLIVTIGVGVMAGLAAQTWFHPGTSLASGDTGLPDGTAWIGRLFEPWAWSGSNLGEPSQLPLALPWAAILGFVHAVGGDPGLAQRLWYTMLFAGAAVGAVGLIWALRLGPIAAAVAATVYVLNPFVVSSVNTNPVFLAALLPLVAMPAALVAAGTGRLSVRWSAVIVAGATPFVGYVFFNPPLVGMILAATLTAPLIVAWVDGREAGTRSLKALALAIPLFLALSAYWIIPAALHLRGFSGGQFASIASWSWTETRATVRNAFWLNNTWGWNFPEYYPYATAYDGLPLSAARFVLPALAFGALALRSGANSAELRFRSDRLLRIATVAATVALLLILLSTGTNPPGNTVFNPLYNLPFGWLLREPGRFLMLTSLAYAMLIAVTVEALFSQPAAEFMSLLRRSLPVRGLWTPSLRLSVVPIALATSILLGFPMYTGAVAPDSRAKLPPAHVQMPAYWRQMAGFVDQLPTQGGVLVLPPDDYYAMPYSWGYYGADNFVVDLFRRPVLVPNSQGGYVSTSGQVLNAVNLTAESILNHDWHQAEVLVTALNTPLVLVRLDIVAKSPGRSILPPTHLSEALDTSPNFVSVRRIGDLVLYALTSAISQSDVVTHFVTADTLTPDLRILGLFPANTAIISSSAQGDVPNAVLAPPLEQWQIRGDSAFWRSSSPLGWTYRVGDLESKSVVALDREGTIQVGSSQATVTYQPGAAGNDVTVSTTGHDILSNGNFAEGAWGLVGGCLAGSPGARVITAGAPGGLPALVLSAVPDNACAGHSLDWRGGSLLLSLMVNHVAGKNPRLCLFESGPEHCLAIASLPAGQGWSTYQVAVTPDVGTTVITLFVYADTAGPNNQTTNEYANVRVLEMHTAFALLGDPQPQAQPPSQLAIVHSSFSTEWRGPTGGTHVLVDGMLNGWWLPVGSRFSAEYGPATVFHGAIWLSLVALGVLLMLPLPWSRLKMSVRLRQPRREQRPPS